MRNDTPLLVGGPKPRALLALLLLHANESVSRDRLLEELWGDRAIDAGHSLDVQISRLRKALGADVLHTRGGGYALEIAPESIDALRYVAANINVPIAAGERNYNLYQFKEIIDTGAVSLIRPDLSLAGGFTQVKKIAALAESALIGVFPHLMGSPVNMAAYVQLDAAIPNYFLQEAYPAADRLNDILEKPLQRDGGYVVVPDGPGLGIEIREDKLANFPYRPHKIGGWFREDGSVAH